MAKDVIPSNDRQLLAVSTTIADGVAPAPEDFGLDAPAVAELRSLTAAFADALAAATDPKTRGHATVFAKSEAKKLLAAYLRRVVRNIQGCIKVSDQQRTDLGLPVRKAVQTPVPPPTAKPRATAAAGPGRTLQVTVQDPDDGRRSRPDGAAGTTILSYVGEVPPADVSGWTFEQNVSGREATLYFNASLPPGTLVWVTAFYYNARGQSGPAATPACDHLGGAGVVMGGATDRPAAGQAYPKAA